MEVSTSAKSVSIKSDAESVIATQLQELVTAYNAINTSIKTISASDSTLANSMKSVQNSLKNYLTSKSLVSLGISSDWEAGALSFDSATCSTAYTADSQRLRERRIYSIFQIFKIDNYLIFTDINNNFTEHCRPLLYDGSKGGPCR